MGIINSMRSFFSNTRASIENPSTPLNGDTLGALFQRGSTAGVAVDEYSIIGLPAFYRATQILGGVLKHPGRLTNEAYDRLKGSFNRAFGGSQNAGGTAILEEGMDFQKVGLNPADAAFNETKKATISDIARITGVPGVLLEDMDKATFSNMEQLSQMFVNYTIMPLCETIESEFNRKIFFEVEKDKYSTRFNLDGLLRGDVAARSSYYTTMRNVLAMSPNEIRIKENMNPYPGGDSYELPLASNIKIEPSTEGIAHEKGESSIDIEDDSEEEMNGKENSKD